MCINVAIEIPIVARLGRVFLSTRVAVQDSPVALILICPTVCGRRHTGKQTRFLNILLLLQILTLFTVNYISGSWLASRQCTSQLYMKGGIFQAQLKVIIDASCRAEKHTSALQSR